MSGGWLSVRDGFLGMDADTGSDPAEPRAAGAVVICAGLEASVSYGAGTAAGPAAIVAASHQVELFDELWWRQPVHDWGVATRAPLELAAEMDVALRQIEAEVRAALDAGQFPCVLGGEHSVTAGAIRAAVQRWPGLVLLHFDAHADLRDGYLGEPFSHASAIRRCLDQPGHDQVSTVSVGIRSISASEIGFLEANRDRIHVWWSRDRARWDIERLVAPLAGRPVWVTFDVDGLDPAIMPSTGTPEPGGLSWDEAMAVLSAARRVSTAFVGADIVELAPVPGQHAPDFLAARLAYRIMAFALSGAPDGVAH